MTRRCLLQPPPPQVHARRKAGALMFACQRDNGANVLRSGFREGTLSKFERNAYHAFTEDRFYIAPTPAGARAYRIGGATASRGLGLFSEGRCNAAAAPHVTYTALADGRRSVLSQREKKSNANTCMAEARSLGGGFRRNRHGDCRLLATRVEDGRDGRATCSGPRQHGRRLGPGTFLCGEGPDGHPAGCACQLPG